MARLLSHHDKFHVHAILGLIALSHLFVRIFLWLVYGWDSFSPGPVSAGLLLVHVCLHATSFQFELPRNRIWTKPMIWKEFRVHNAIFAYRHLIGTAMGIWFPDLWWRNFGWASLLLKVMLVLAACKAADVATEHLGSDEARTTNAMPYPTKTAKNLEQMAKWFYAKSQFAATSLAAFGTPLLCFASILAIEAASFLMTLVRKGIIEDWVYHTLYALSLFIMFPIIARAYVSAEMETKVAIFRALVATFISVEMRMNYKFNKYLTWVVSLVCGSVFTFILTDWLHVNVTWLAWLGMTSSAVDTLLIFWRARQNDRLYSKDAKVAKAEAESAHGSTRSTDMANVTSEEASVSKVAGG